MGSYRLPYRGVPHMTEAFLRVFAFPKLRWVRILRRQEVIGRKGKTKKTKRNKLEENA
jgi:hypothetical protein